MHRLARHDSALVAEPFVPDAELAEGYIGVGSTRDYSDAALHEPIVVSMQRGPRMAVREFSIHLDGTVEDEKRLRGFLRCSRSGRTHQISKGLLAKLADLAKPYEGHTIEIVSAYRHGENAKPGSRHRHGRALDIKIDGVPAVKVRDYLWGRYDVEVGVGFYRQQQFVHLDHRADFPATAWTQKRHNEENTYKPRWARNSKRSELVVSVAP